MRQKKAWTTMYTTAPETYDGFGTHTLTMQGTWCGTAIRAIAVQTQHTEWQMQRNGSGMYCTWTASEFAQAQQQRGYAP